jgi:hypothetical protein
MVHINNTTQPNPYMAQLLTKCMTSVEDAITKEFKWARSIAQWQKIKHLTEKLLRQVGWQGRVRNNRNSSHDVWSPDCRVLTQMYSPNLFSLVIKYTIFCGVCFSLVYIKPMSQLWKSAVTDISLNISLKLRTSLQRVTYILQFFSS